MSSDDSRPVAPPRTLAPPPPADDAPTKKARAPRSRSKTAPRPSSTDAPTSSTDTPTQQHGVIPAASAPAGESSPRQQSATVPTTSGGGSGPSGSTAPETGSEAAAAGSPTQPPRPASRTRTVRRAKLRLMRVDPWSITKSAFLLSIAFGIMCVVAVFLILSIMNAAGLWDSVNETIQGLINQSPEEAFDINDYVGMSRVLGITMLIAAIDVVILTALATLGAFLYNMSASLLGGVEVTLAEDLK